MTAKVITVTSGKGGVGKTTATANLSVALGLSGQRVVADDRAPAGLAFRNITQRLLGEEIPFMSWTSGRCPILMSSSPSSPGTWR